VARKVAIHARHTRGTWRFRCTKQPRLGFGSTTVVAPSDWPSATGLVGDAVSPLRQLLDQEDVSVEGDELIVPESIIASLEIAPEELPDIDLPPICPFRLRISSAKPITDTSGTISLTWIGVDHHPVPAVSRTGTLLTTGGKRFLLREPLYSLVNAIEATNAAPDMYERMRRFAEVRRHLIDVGSDADGSQNLMNMIIYQVTGLRIDSRLGSNGYEFHPVLLGDLPTENEEDVPQRIPLLDRTEHERFLAEMQEAQSRGLEEARSSYVLTPRQPSGTPQTQQIYVVLDPGVKAALKVVRDVSKRDAEARKAFFEDKFRYLLPALREAGSDGSVVEFSDRVLGIFEWPGGTKLGGGDGDNEWFPDSNATTFIIKDARGQEILIPADRAEETVAKIRDAFAAGKSTVTIEGHEYQLDDGVLEEVARIPITVRPTPSSADDEPAAKPRYWYLKPQGNIEELSYIEKLADGRGEWMFTELGLRRQPHSHQLAGISWLQHGYLVGMRGILLADDMGAGKTFQVIAFLKWMKNRLSQKRTAESDPLFMIVAPKTLLGNWLEEVEKNLGKDGLGKAAHVYGNGLREFRKVTKRRDIDAGEETLDREKLKQYDWVLTTYETLRDYQISFAKMNFEVISFDEAQKIKESGSMVTEAARAQKAAALRIMMTGTPVENGLMDLWTLLDVAWPGRLGMSATEFRRRYIINQEANLDELRKVLSEPTNDNGIRVPALMLRRMKDEILSLPKKEFEQIRETMPTVQADAYARAITIGRSMGGALHALQAIRNISLHPNLQTRVDYSDPKSIEAFIGMSARMKAAFQALDQIRSLNQRALLFVDLYRAQDILAEIIMRRYRLDFRPRVINGQTAQEARDSIRKGFEKRKGFEVLLLAPKAAGFGLNLVSANHVIHLNRWWNPAVEDQCTDRVYRLGQKLDVKVWFPIAVHPEYGEQSYDVVLNNLLENKRKTSRDVIVSVGFDAKDVAKFHDNIFGRGSGLDQDLADMDWKSFEEWTMRQLRDAGFIVDRTPSSGDAGADAILRIRNDMSRGAIIQVKHRQKGRVGIVSERDVEDVLRAKQRYSGFRDVACALVTNGSVEPRGTKVAENRGITIIDHSNIDRLVDILKSVI